MVLLKAPAKAKANISPFWGGGIFISRVMLSLHCCPQVSMGRTEGDDSLWFKSLGPICLFQGEAQRDILWGAGDEITEAGAGLFLSTL